jgi:hypothetical protein
MKLDTERTDKQISIDIVEFSNYLSTRQIDFVKCTVILWPANDREREIQPKEIRCGCDAHDHGVLHVAYSDYNLCFISCIVRRIQDFGGDTWRKETTSETQE